MFLKGDKYITQISEILTSTPSPSSKLPYLYYLWEPYESPTEETSTFPSSNPGVIHQINHQRFNLKLHP